jgi:hypothetical protein
MWHIVVALDGERIAQVQCGECGARHRYRPPGGSAAAGARRRSPARKSPSDARKCRAGPVVEADPSRPSRPFSPRDTYQVGDRLVHPTFGEGVVQTIQGATKVTVLFEAGTKLLVQGRGRS